MLDIVDSKEEDVLKKNSCSVFIVPVGMMNQLDGEENMRSLQEQIHCSRLILVRVMAGNNVKSIKEIQEELNGIMPNIIQRGCDIGKVPYLTDGEFRERNYLFKDEEIFIEEVMVGEEYFRRLMLANAPSIVQSQAQLIYLA